MTMEGETSSFWVCSPATPGEEQSHGSHNHILPHSGRPRQRRNSSGQRAHPLGQGSLLALTMYRSGTYLEPLAAGDCGVKGASAAQKDGRELHPAVVRVFLGHHLAVVRDLQPTGA